MKREFTDENFEHFLQSSADNLRMRAPDKVWKNISRQLNRRRRRLVFGITALLLITSGIGYYTITTGKQQNSVTVLQRSHQPVASITNKSALQSPHLKSTEAVVTPQTRNHFKIQAKNILQPIERPVLPSSQGAVSEPAIEQTVHIPSQQDDFIPTVVDSYPGLDKERTGTQQLSTSVFTENDRVPLTIESVLNSYKLKLRKKKIETQLYFTPTISYRKLNENKTYLRSVNPASATASYSALYSSVNNEVTHKPDVGFELGITTKYPLSKKLMLRTGVQFNVNRYDVKAFSSYLSDVTIALNNRSGVDSLSALSAYSNIYGYKANWLQNFSFQISAPVGVELLLGGTDKDKMQFGIAGTIQPTYVLGDRAYLISTDYKNYALVPWLARRWNVNTAFETFVTYNTGKTKWQVGPQVRYQLLSSFIDKYPVKENLFDFGLKIGLSLNK